MLELLIPILVGGASRRCRNVRHKTCFMCSLTVCHAKAHKSEYNTARKIVPYYIIGISTFLTDCKNTEI